MEKSESGINLQELPNDDEKDEAKKKIAKEEEAKKEKDREKQGTLIPS